MSSSPVHRAYGMEGCAVGLGIEVYGGGCRLYTATNVLVPSCVIERVAFRTLTA